MYKSDEGLYSPILTRQELEVWCRRTARPSGTGRIRFKSGLLRIKGKFLKITMDEKAVKNGLKHGQQSRPPVRHAQSNPDAAPTGESPVARFLIKLIFGDITMSDEKRYEFITEGSGIDCGVHWVCGVNPSNALINYCKYTEEIKGARMEAICSLCFESAIQLANEWLVEKILNIHEIGAEIFSVSSCRITTI